MTVRTGTGLKHVVATAALLSAVAMAPPAGAAVIAAPGTAPAGVEQVARLVTPTGSLTVTALVNGPVDRTRAAGVVFTLRRVEGVDLRTEAGWAAALAYASPDSAPTPTLGATFTLPPTDTEGVTSIGDLPIGLYRLSAEGWADVYLTLPARMDPALIAGTGTTDSAGYAVAVYPKRTPPLPTAPGTSVTTPPQSPPESTQPGTTQPGTTETGTQPGTTAPGPDTTRPTPGPGGTTPPNQGTQPRQATQPNRSAFLPYTGGDIAEVLLVAVGAITLGTALLGAARRRRESD